MKVLVIASSYPSTAGDWKGTFIRNHVDGLARRPDVQLDLWAPPGPLPRGVQRASTEEEAAWLHALSQRGGIAHLLRRRPHWGIPAAAGLLLRARAACRRSGADLYHVHWLQNALALPDDGRPAVVTALGTDMQLLSLPGMRALLRRAMSRRRTAICPNAQWMVPRLRQAFGDVAQVRYVPFGIEDAWYALERRFESEPLPVWLCVTRITRGKVGPLFDWTAPLFAGGEAELHLLGPMQEPTEFPPWVHWHGPATPEQLRHDWFPRAHGLITLSQHAEGRPQVMLEAMAAGLPIVASPLAAHLDLLGGGAGYLCGTAESTARAVRALAAPDHNRSTGLQARALMWEEMGTWDDCAARYLRIYQEIGEQAAT